MADLHLATIEALALAIDAKDQTSQSHIRRVQLYAASVARALGMSDNDVQGVKTAALLHDIGKLAVPEHILSKPGPLTPEEFQKIRAHPKVGADIVSSVPFPYPVAPLILSHHERWDGKGYPDRSEGRRDSARRAHPVGRRLLRRADGGTAVSQGHELRRRDRAAAGRSRARASTRRSSRSSSSCCRRCNRRRRSSKSRCGSRSADAAGQILGRPATGLSPRTAKKNVFEDIALAHREIYALYEIAQAMGTSLGVSDTMALIAAKLSNLVPFSCAALFLFDEDTESLRCRFATGHRRRSDSADRGPQRRGPDRLGGAQPPAARQRAAERRPRGGRARPTTTLQSALVCPLLFNDQFIGTLSVYHTEPAFYRDDHRRLLDRVSEQAGAVIKNSMLFEQTQSDSLTDPLTGLPNTRYLFMQLTRELSRAERLQSEISLMVMDLDNFKEINDNHGHHVGDRALCEIARVLRTTIRPYDICVRYAGDEFIVVMSGCGAEEAEQKRDELQRAIDAVFFEARPGKRIRIGVSIGTAVFPHDGDSYEVLLATADSRMYQNKADRKRRTREDEQQRAAAATVPPRRPW